MRVTLRLVWLRFRRAASLRACACICPYRKAKRSQTNLRVTHMQARKEKNLLSPRYEHVLAYVLNKRCYRERACMRVSQTFVWLRFVLQPALFRLCQYL
jgi:hypothetical protein